MSVHLHMRLSRPIKSMSPGPCVERRVINATIDISPLDQHTLDIFLEETLRAGVPSEDAYAVAAWAAAMTWAAASFFPPVSLLVELAWYLVTAFSEGEEEPVFVIESDDVTYTLYAIKESK